MTQESFVATEAYRRAGQCLINGVLRDADQASISIYDRGFLYGDALFETVPVYGGRPFLLPEHLARLCAGGGALRFEQPLDPGLLTEWVMKLIEVNQTVDGIVRIAVSRGCSNQFGIRWAVSLVPTVVVTVAPPRVVPRVHESLGIVLHKSECIHPSPAMLPTRFKHANYLGSVLAYDEAVRAGADEALLLNEHGRVCEAALSNVFFVLDGLVVTPSLDEGALAGVTRYIVLALAAQSGLATQERPLTYRHIQDSTECFITNSVIGVLPVRALESVETAYPSVYWREPGPVTRQLADAYWTRVEREAGAPWHTRLLGNP